MPSPRPLPWLLLGMLAAGVALRGGVTPLGGASLHAGVALLGLFAARRGWMPAVSSQALGLVLAWVGLALVSIAWSQHRDASLDGLAAVSAASAAFLLGAALVGRRARRGFAVGFALLGALVAGAALVVVDSGARASWPFGNPNHLASWLLLPACFGCVATLSRDMGERGRREDALLWFGLVGLSGAGLAASASLGAALAALAALVGLLLLRKLGAVRGLAVAAVGLASLALASLLLPWIHPDLLPSMPGGLESSPGLRWTVWSAAARAAADFAPLGAGLGVFPQAFALHRPEGLLYAPRHAHNEFLQGLVELGLPFLLLALWSGVVSVGHLGRRLSSVPSTLRWGVGAALLALFAHGLVDFPLHVPVIALAGALLGGMLWGAERQRSPGAGGALLRSQRVLAAVSLVALLASGSQGLAAWAARDAEQRTEIGDFDAALRSAQLGLWVRPGNAALFSALARAGEHSYRFGAGDRAEFLPRVLAARARAVAASPLDARLRLEQARSLARAGQQTAALVALEEAARLDPSSPAPHVAMAKLHLDLRADTDAALALGRAVSRHPRMLVSAATKLLEATGRPDLLASLSDRERHARNVGGVLAQAGYARPAAEAFRRALKGAPADAELAMRAARQFVRAGDPQAAEAVLRRTLLHAPEDSRLQRSLERLRAEGRTG